MSEVQLESSACLFRLCRVYRAKNWNRAKVASAFRFNADSRKRNLSLVRERTIPTEKPPLIGEVTANFC
jgi:hypothetical protein